MSKTTIPRGGITADAIDATLIADDAISEEHLDATALTGHTALGATPADTDELLVSDAGTLKRVDYSYLKSGTHVKLVSGSASSAVNHDFENFMDSTKYNTYMVQFSKVTGLAGNTLDFQFKANTTVLTNSNYWWAFQGHRSTNNTLVNYGEQSAQATLGSALSASSDERGSYLFYLYNNPNSENFGNSGYGHNWGYRSDHGDYVFTDFAFGFNNSHNVTGFRVHAQGNDATTFDYAIYGITK